MKKFSGKLPNGNTSNSVKYFCKVWKRGMPVMEKVYGLKLAAFDPGYQFSFIESPNGPHVTLGYNFVQTMIKVGKNYQVKKKK